MSEVVELLRDWQLLLLALLEFGVAPGLVLRLVVRIYPKGHLRREELLGELYAMNFVARPLWVAQQFETAIFEGLSARRVRRKLLPFSKHLLHALTVAEMSQLSADGYRTIRIPAANYGVTVVTVPLMRRWLFIACMRCRRYDFAHRVLGCCLVFESSLAEGPSATSST